MRKLLFILAVLCAETVIAQPNVTRASGANTVYDTRLGALKNFYLPRYADTTAANLEKGTDSCGAKIYTYDGNKEWIRACNPKRWENVGTSTFDATTPSTSTITGLGGVTLGTTDIASTLQALIYPSQAPTAGLTGGFTVEKVSVANATKTLIWTAGRLPNTAPIATITVAGVSQSFTQPAAGASVSGTQSVSIPQNDVYTYTNTVVTTDGKSATATVTLAYRDYRYYGFTATSTPSNSTVQALAKDFITARTKGATTITPSGSQYAVIAFPESWDASNTSEIWVGGLNQTGTFTRSVASFTNASGYTSNYIFYISNSPTSGAITFEIK